MELKEDYKKFQREISKRGIEYLIHFTPTINLCSILKQGKLISREMLESSNIDFILDYIQFTDEVRLDGKGFINLSISGPSTNLFANFKRKKENDPTIHWCILKIDPKHIYEKETKFAVTNAATGILKTRPEIGITGDIDKFKMLFADEIKYIKYGKRGSSTAPKYTTNIQAEVLVKNEIPVESIIEVCFKTQEELDEAKNLCSQEKALCSQFYTDNFDNFVVDEKIFSLDRNL